MSANMKVKTEFKNAELIVAALKACGIRFDQGKGLAIYDYHTHMVGNADIVIRRAVIGTTYANDIGFVKGDDGTYTVLISDYDYKSQEILKAVKQQYAVAYVNVQAKKIGAKVLTSVKEDGTIVMSVSRRGV